MHFKGLNSVFVTNITLPPLMEDALSTLAKGKIFSYIVLREELLEGIAFILPSWNILFYLSFMSSCLRFDPIQLSDG